MNQSSQNRKTRRTVLCVLSAILLALSSGAFFAASWYVRTYGNTGFDSILFTLTGGLNGLQGGLVTSYMLGGFLPAVLCTVILQLILFFPSRFLSLKATLFGKKRQLFPLHAALSTVLALVITVTLLVTASNKVGLFSYLQAYGKTGYIYEEEDLPADFICPICKHGAVDFEKI